MPMAVDQLQPWAVETMQRSQAKNPCFSPDIDEQILWGIVGPIEGVIEQSLA
jgi:hypothetical protein